MRFKQIKPGDTFIAVYDDVRVVYTAIKPQYSKQSDLWINAVSGKKEFSFDDEVSVELVKE